MIFALHSSLEILNVGQDPVLIHKIFQIVWQGYFHAVRKVGDMFDES
jgi:hypothetical protein